MVSKNLGSLQKLASPMTDAKIGGILGAIGGGIVGVLAGATVDLLGALLGAILGAILGAAVSWLAVKGVDIVDDDTNLTGIPDELPMYEIDDREPIVFKRNKMRKVRRELRPSAMRKTQRTIPPGPDPASAIPQISASRKVSQSYAYADNPEDDWPELDS